MIYKLLVFAYLEEARPFIEYYSSRYLYNLKTIQCLFSEQHNTYILITGGGFHSTSVAITSFFERYSRVEKDIICFNIGIAGSFKLPLYEVFYASKIINYHNYKSFYPDVFIKAPYAELMSIEFSADKKIMQQYPEAMFDMEAYSFVSACRYFVKNHHIHCIKFISDNNGIISDMFEMLNAYKKVFPKFLEIIDSIIEKIHPSHLSVDQDIANMHILHDFAEKHSFTYSQKRILDRAARYYVHYHSIDDLHHLLQQYANVKTKLKSERDNLFEEIINLLYYV